MDDKVNSGSFMAPLGGGGSAVANAIARRMPGGVLSQVSPTAPTFGSQAQAPSVPAGSPSGLPAPAPAQAQQAAPSAPQGLPAGNPEAQIIVNALTTRLKSLSKQEEGKPQGM